MPIGRSGIPETDMIGICIKAPGKLLMTGNGGFNGN
jgi:hypothetical protein